MQPIVATSGKVAQLRYELPHRAHDSAVYPVKAPNGSTIILYGHETGVRIAWRGGRRFKENVPAQKQPARPAKVNGAKAKDDAIMIIDSDDDEPASAAAVPVAEFEDEDEELDPDQPYLSIIQQIDLALNTEVLYLTVPNVPVVSSLRPADTIPPILQNRLVCAVTCADSTVRIITLPLIPPTDAAKANPPKGKSQYGEEIVKIHGHQSMARGITMTWTARGEPIHKHEADEMDVDGEGKTTATPGRRHRRQQSEVAAQPKEDGFDVLVATHSAELGGLLKIWRFQLADSSIKVSHPIAPYKTLTLRKPASRIAFSAAQYPKHRHSQLLIADTAGTARIYDVHATSAQRRATGGAQSDPGAFIATFRSTFESIKNNSYTPAILAARKPILDVAWTSDGLHILALLADGEWGVWDVDRSGPSPPADPSAFSLRAFVGTTEKEGSAAPASPKRSGRSSLAPMTPNTRRRKEETLFQGSLTNTSVASRGGISVQSLHLTGGSASGDSVIIWYGSEIYRIADLTKFWGRVASGASSATSLPSPGIVQLPHVSLYGASITSISQFDSTAEAARLARPRDLLILAEYRLLITTTTTQTLGHDFNSILAREQSETEDTRRSDQALLSHGELDLGGMDRMLDDMEDSGTLPKTLTLGNPRKVLFASSAA